MTSLLINIKYLFIRWQTNSLQIHCLSNHISVWLTMVLFNVLVIIVTIICPYNSSVLSESHKHMIARYKQTREW